MNQNSARPMIDRIGQTAALGALLAVCALGVRVAWADGWNTTIGTSLADDPTQPVLLLARVLLLALSVWVGSCTMAAVIARALRLTRACETIARLLPAFARSLVVRSFAKPVASAGLVGTLFLAQPASAAVSTTTTTTNTAPVPSVHPISVSGAISDPVGGDVTNGQHWPSHDGVLPPLLDLDAPVLRAPTVRAASTDPGTTHQGTAATTSTSATASTTPGAHRTSTPARGALSVPTSVPASVPPSTTASTNTSATISATTSATATTQAVPTTAAKSASTTTIAPPSAQAAAGSTYTVKPGDHFWSIAERTIRAVDATADETQVRRYWIRLVEANVATLHDRSNPDLLHVGTRVTIPPVADL